MRRVGLFPSRATFLGFPWVLFRGLEHGQHEGERQAHLSSGMGDFGRRVLKARNSERRYIIRSGFWSVQHDRDVPLCLCVSPRTNPHSRN